jgi:uncharacterized protein (DUF305 family)
MTWSRGRSLIGVAAVLAVAAAALVAFSDSGEPAPDKASQPVAIDPSAAPIIVPGQPGESAKVFPPGGTRAPRQPGPSVAEANFVRLMIPHHTQAVEMAALAPDRASNPQLVAIANRIRAAQVPEIAQFRAWLQLRKLSEQTGPGGEHVDHGSMRGMQSPEAMKRLADTRGAAFDKLFVEMMIAHHQGAIDMATDVLAHAVDVEIERMATGIAGEQTVEIDRLRDVLAG